MLRGTEERVRALPAADWVSGEVKARRRALVKEFLSDVLGCKTCDRCGAPKATVRKDGFTKFFLKGGAGRRGPSTGVRPQSALARVRGAGGEDDAGAADDSEDEEDLSSESDEEEAGQGQGQGGKRQQSATAARKGAASKRGEGDKYMAPVEVQMHMKLLWEAEPELATLIWGKASAAAAEAGHEEGEGGSRKRKRPLAWQADRTGWRTFFWRVLPIAPSRFRPPSRNDDGSMAEHAQNYNIIKIMQLDERIRTLLNNGGTGDGAAGAGGDGGEEKGAGEGGDDDAIAQMSPEALSRVLSSWIDLQNAVNGYIDSRSVLDNIMTCFD